MEILRLLSVVRHMGDYKSQLKALKTVHLRMKMKVCLAKNRF